MRKCKFFFGNHDKQVLKCESVNFFFKTDCTRWLTVIKVGSGIMMMTREAAAYLLIIVKPSSTGYYYMICLSWTFLNEYGAGILWFSKYIRRLLPSKFKVDIGNKLVRHGGPLDGRTHEIMERTTARIRISWCYPAASWNFWDFPIVTHIMHLIFETSMFVYIQI